MSLQDKEYRDAFVAENIRTVLAQQIRSLRERRGWSQNTLGEEAGTRQSVIARLEDPDYGRMSIATLLNLAGAFDVAVVVKFVSLSKFLREYEDLSPEALGALTLDEEREEAAKTRSVDRSRPRYIQIPQLPEAQTEPPIFIGKSTTTEQVQKGTHL